MPETSDPDTLPTPMDPTGPCPWCGRISNFDSQGSSALAWSNSSSIGASSGAYATHTLSTLKCSGCRRVTAVVTDQMGRGVHWYPAPGMGLMDPQVHKGVASSYDEGMRCLGIGAYRAAAVMFRSALSLFVKDKGGEAAQAKRRHLKNALTAMKADGSLHPSLADWADHLNQLGNEGAHPEDYDDVTKQEATDLGKFVQHLIAHEYEMPARLMRARGLLTDEASGPRTPDAEPPLYGAFGSAAEP
jgi:hypothetical protein